MEKSTLNNTKSSVARIVRIILFILVGVIIIDIGIILTNTDPVKFNKDEQSTGNGQSTLLNTMDAWTEFCNPMREIDYLNVTPHLFGKYTINAHVFDLTKPIIVGGKDNVTFSVALSKIKISRDDDGMYGGGKDTFFKPDYGESDPKEDISEIKKLPESAWLTVDVYTKNARPIETIIKEAEQDNNDDNIYNDIDVDWALVDTKSEVQGGINLLHVHGTEDACEMMTNKDTKHLHEWYMLTVKRMLTHKEFWEDLGLYTPGTNCTVYTTADPLKKLYKYLQKNPEMNSKYYLISGSKEEILKYIKTHDVFGVNIRNVRLSYSAEG